MSFDYNPYEHIEVIKDGNGVRILCGSCGGERPRRNEPPLPLTITAEVLFNAMDHHLLTSHKRTKDDFTGWSKY